MTFEQAARLRDEIDMLEKLASAASSRRTSSPRCFSSIRRRGSPGLQKIFKLETRPRNIEGVDIAHLGGTETVASLVQFLDGLPFKPGYRRFRIRDVEGIDDYASIREVVARRYPQVAGGWRCVSRRAAVDGGIGQLRRAMEAFEKLKIKPPLVLSLAKKEELVYVMNRDKPLRLSRRSYALRLLQYVRDEAHRFAQHYHHLLRRKRQLERMTRCCRPLKSKRQATSLGGMATATSPDSLTAAS